MYDGAYIGLVNTHSECVGGHNHTVTVIGPGTLALVLDHLVQTGVVVCGGYALSIKEIGHLLCAGAVAHIDYA